MERSADLEGVIRGWFESVGRGDASWLERHLTREGTLRIIGTDPTEWLQGERAVALLQGDLKVLGGKIRVEVKDVEAYAEGTVGWGAALPEITLEDGKGVSPRWSGVFRRDGGTWKAVQIHASVGITNEQLFGVELRS